MIYYYYVIGFVLILDRQCPSPAAVAGTLMTLCIALSAGQQRTDRYGDPEVTEMRGAWVQRAHGNRVAYDSFRTTLLICHHIQSQCRRDDE